MDTSLSKLWELEMVRETWHAPALGVTNSQTWLSDWTELSWTDESPPATSFEGGLLESFSEY